MDPLHCLHSAGHGDPSQSIQVLHVFAMSRSRDRSGMADIMDFGSPQARIRDERRDEAIIAFATTTLLQKYSLLPLIYEVMPHHNAAIMSQLFLLPQFTLTLLPNVFMSFLTHETNPRPRHPFSGRSSVLNTRPLRL
jgi:hypothetical protein